MFEQSNIMKELCELTYDMWKKGWDEYNGGNVSCLLSDEDIVLLDNRDVTHTVPLSNIPTNMIGKILLITASGSHFRTLKNHLRRDTGVIHITKDGYEVIWGFQENKRPTSELYKHVLSHSKRLSVDPEHRVVVHNHAPNATAFSLVSEPDDKAYTLPLWRVLTESIVVFPDGVGILPWELPGTLEIARHSVEKLADCRIVVWAFHGILATGKNFQDCFGLIETVDKAAKIHLQTMNIKNYEGLSDQNLYEVCQVLKVTPRSGFLSIG